MNKTNDFNKVAPFYDLMARMVFGHAIQAAPVFYIGQLPLVETILVVGGGSGSILTELQIKFKTARITYIEPSARMTALARSRTSNAHAVDFVVSSLEESQLPDRYYELIITPFVLDLFAEERLGRVMSMLYAKLKPQGHWLHSDFYVADHSPYWQKWLLKFMFRFFRISTNIESRELLDFNSYFQKLPLKYKASEGFYGKMIQSFWYQKTGTL